MHHHHSLFSFVSLTLAQRPKKDECISWEDLYIGNRLEVYGRILLICEADAKTREFYEKNGMPLGDAIFEEERAIVVQKREIPPPTGLLKYSMIFFLLLFIVRLTFIYHILPTFLLNSLFICRFWIRRG